MLIGVVSAAEIQQHKWRSLSPSTHLGDVERSREEVRRARQGFERAKRRLELAESRLLAAKSKRRKLKRTGRVRILHES